MKPLPLRITIAFMLVAALAPTAFADLNMVETGSVLSETWQEPAVFGTTIYVAATTNVTILDASNPADPVEIRKLPLTGTIDGVLVVGSTLYVARGTAGVSIYDIADPENPALIAGWSFRSHRLHHDAGRVYVAGASAGMAIFDVSNPAAPTLLRTYATGDNVGDVATDGSKAYLGVSRSGLTHLRIVDTLPDPPVLLGTIGFGLISSIAPTVARNGSTIYMASPDFEHPALIDIDVTDSANPQLLGYASILDTPTDIQYRNGHVHIVTYNGLKTLDVTTPSAPLQVQHIPYYDSRHTALVGDRLYAAAGILGLFIFDVSSPAAATTVAWHETYRGAGSLTVNGDRVYASGSRLWVVDISDPAQPVVSGDVPVAGAHRSVVVGSRLYVAGDAAGLLVMDITDPDNPVIVDADPTYLVIDVRVSGNFLYATDTTNRLRIYDLDDPDNPEPRGSVATVTRPYYMALYGNHVYMTDLNSRIFVVDVTNPDAPLLVNTVTETAKDLEVGDGRLYIAGYADGLQIFDLANPVVPALVGTHDFPQNTNSVDIQGTRAFVTNELGPVSVLDVTNPASIVEVGNHGTPAFSYDIAAAGNLAITAMNGRIVIYQLTGTASVDSKPGLKPPVIQLAAAPNPTRGPTHLTIRVDVSGPLDVSLYDITGRLIRRWPLNAQQGANTITWDPTSGPGPRLAPGTYLLEARTPTARTTQRLTLIH